MAKFIINKGYNGQVPVEAEWYRQQGDFFYFFEDSSTDADKVILTYAASKVSSIHKEK